MSAPVISCSPNGEDVVLLRALNYLPATRYVMLGSTQALDEGWSRALDAAGWAGSRHLLADEPAARDETITSVLQDLTSDVHALWVSVPDQARLVFSALNHMVRPWVIVAAVSSAQLRSQADADAVPAGYSSALFDGVSTYYVAREHEHLMPVLSYPRCTRDEFVSSAEHSARELNDSLLLELIHWRTTALVGWAAEVTSPQLTGSGTPAALAVLSDELTAMRTTLSWRITRPLRAARRLLDRAAARS